MSAKQNQANEERTEAPVAFKQGWALEEIRRSKNELDAVAAFFRAVGRNGA